jgi:hypothetical protein
LFVVHSCDGVISVSWKGVTIVISGGGLRIVIWVVGLIVTIAGRFLSGVAIVVSK